MRIFLTHILPEDYIKKYKLSFAACNFSRNLMSGKGFDKVISILPLFVKGNIEHEAFEDSSFDLVYSFFFRNLGRRFTFLASVVEQFRVFCSIPRFASIWTYNVTTLSAFLLVLIRVFKPSIKINVIVLDFTPVQKLCGLNKIYLKIINSAHGNICLANSDLFTCGNKKILPGVVPINAGTEPMVRELNKKFLLSGVLNERIAQISMVLDAFSELPQCELHITGEVENEDMIMEYTHNFPNIIYHGKIPFSDYLEVLHSCTFQLSTRNPDYLENQCNFPSKVIEALLHNRIVISTIDYPQLDGINYFKVGTKIKDFVRDILGIVQTCDIKLFEYANQGKVIKDKYNPYVWNTTMSLIENNESNILL